MVTGTKPSPRSWGEPLLLACPPERWPVKAKSPRAQGQPTLALGWEKAIQDAVTELSATMKHARSSRMDRLEQRVANLEQSFHAAVFTRLSSLGISGYTVQKPIPVTVRQDGDEFVATFFDANISTGGDTEQEAVSNLQSLIADFYDDLVTTPDEELGPSLRKQKLVLVEFLCRT
jgi:hypothetical protein